MKFWSICRTPRGPGALPHLQGLVGEGPPGL